MMFAIDHCNPKDTLVHVVDASTTQERTTPTTRHTRTAHNSLVDPTTQQSGISENTDGKTVAAAMSVAHQPPPPTAALPPPAPALVAHTLLLLFCHASVFIIYEQRFSAP